MFIFNWLIFVEHHTSCFIFWAYWTSLCLTNNEDLYLAALLNIMRGGRFKITISTHFEEKLHSLLAPFRSALTSERSEQGRIEERSRAAVVWHGKSWHYQHSGVCGDDGASHSFSQGKGSDHAGSILPLYACSPPAERRQKQSEERKLSSTPVLSDHRTPEIQSPAVAVWPPQTSQPVLEAEKCPRLSASQSTKVLWAVTERLLPQFREGESGSTLSIHSRQAPKP